MRSLLTGGVQIGKARWLERLAAELAGDGVPVAGVLAPGVWRVREPHEVPGERGLAGEGRFEKLGIGLAICCCPAAASSADGAAGGRSVDGNASPSWPGRSPDVIARVFCFIRRGR